MRYTIRFKGRLRGAIGIFYVIDAEVEAPPDDDRAAVLQLYNTYEHVMLPVLVALDGVKLPSGGRMMQR